MKYLIVAISSLALIPALLPSQFQIERSINIEESRQNVYSYLVNLDSWKEWSPWLAKEPSAAYSFHGIPGVVGSYVIWDGEEIGAGKQTLISLQEPEYLETKLEFFEPTQRESVGYMKLEETGGQVKVTWGMKGELSYPLGRVFGLFLESMVAPDFSEGLNTLKKQLEEAS